MSEEHNIKIVRGWVKNVFNRQSQVDVPDYKARNNYKTHTPFPGTTPDVPGFLNAFNTVLAAFPDFQFDIDEIIAKENIVVVRGTWTGTHKGDYMGIPPTGKKVAVTRLDMLKVENGMIVEHWGFGDDWNKIRQLTTDDYDS
ncbi:MAG: ester cyclase [Blastocatellia bacterium]|jgi:predicted ester cyclase